MRSLLTIAIMLFFFCSSYGQKEPAGNWYGFSSDMFQVIQYNFDKSTFTCRKLDWELKDQPEMETAKILQTVESKGSLYYLLQDLEDTSIIALSIFSSFNQSNSFIHATASKEHTYFKSMEEALAFIEKDSVLRPGLTLHSQKEFDRLRTLPDASTITKENYSKYLQGLIESRESFERFASKNKDDFGFMFFIIYLCSQARETLANLGYNPVIDDKQLEQVGKIFLNDPALKTLSEKAFKFEEGPNLIK